MKISVCFTGHLRTFRKCLSNYSELLKGHEVKYFMHTWNEVSPQESSWHGFDLEPKKVSENDLDFIKRNLINLELICDDQSEIISQNLTVREKVFRCVNYSQSAVLELALKKSLPDLILCTRPDIRFYNNKLTKFIANCDLDKFYVLGNSNNTQELSGYSACDAVNFANPSLFRKKVGYFKENLPEFSSSFHKNGWMYQRFMDEIRTPVEVAPLHYQKDWGIQRPPLAVFRNLRKKLNEKK